MSSMRYAIIGQTLVVLICTSFSTTVFAQEDGVFGWEPTQEKVKPAPQVAHAKPKAAAKQKPKQQNPGAFVQQQPITLDETNNFLASSTTVLPQNMAPSQTTIRIAEPHSSSEQGTPPPNMAVQLYCKNVADAAADARFLSQKAELGQLEEQLAHKSSLLDEKRAEFQKWLQRRDDFIHKAEDGLVALYTKVKPEAASAQLSVMDEETASAVLLRLNPRTASAILDQMKPEKAAHLVAIVVGASKKPDPAIAAAMAPSPKIVSAEADASEKEQRP